MRSFANAAVGAVFAAYPLPVRRPLLALRTLIFDTAAVTPGVGELEETLKWGEPAYLTPHSRSGSTVRLGWSAKRPDTCAMYFNCQTDLVDTFRTLFAQDLRFEGNRALVFRVGEPLPPEDVLTFCVAAALTYHVRTGPRGGVAAVRPA